MDVKWEFWHLPTGREISFESEEEGLDEIPMEIVSTLDDATGALNFQTDDELIIIPTHILRECRIRVTKKDIAEDENGLD